MRRLAGASKANHDPEVRAVRNEDELSAELTASNRTDASIQSGWEQKSYD